VLLLAIILEPDKLDVHGANQLKEPIKCVHILGTKPHRIPIDCSEGDRSDREPDLAIRRETPECLPYELEMIRNVGLFLERGGNAPLFLRNGFQKCRI
jgi:hypothetical protein